MSAQLSPRIGHGYDIHRLQPGGKLVLGGVIVSTDQSPIAHSDGDVAIHALVDALLGALGKGDIGQMFPPSDPKWKNADSFIFLNAAMDEIKSAGYRVGNADITILLDRPRLAPFRDQIRQKLAPLLNCNLTDINIKFDTNENCDAVGFGQAIAAHAVIMLLPLA